MVLDEAYVEFVDGPGFQDSLALRKRYPNLVVLRTFSKIYGLAGLRLGYGIARPELIASSTGCAPPSTSTWWPRPPAWPRSTTRSTCASRRLVASERPMLRPGLRTLGATVVPSQANFVLADFPGGPAWRSSRRSCARRVVVRPVAGYGFPTGQRITVGTATPRT